MTWFQWPLPALFAWVTAWCLYALLVTLGLPQGFAVALAVCWGALPATLMQTPMRRALVVLGFPVSLMASMNASGNGFSMPPWGWLLLLGLLVVLYPRRAWRDAPLFPTPREALAQLPALMQLPERPAILDAGSGMGDGLIALHAAFPQARLEGIEMSWPLRILSAMRCRYARIRQGDIWRVDWSAYDMVYLFQQPMSMPRAVEKASAELLAGAWLVSLEFEALPLQAQAVAKGSDGRPVWLYQAPFKRRK